jgi:cyclophilin family peptidyl-prolyl cis-trans isomerase/protein-disulfide isomerase
MGGWSKPMKRAPEAHSIPLFAACLLFVALAGCSSRQPASTVAPTKPVIHTLVPTAASTGTPAMGCSILSAQPTQAAAQGLPPVTPSDYVRGPENGPVTLLAYCDFQSGQCELFNRVQDQLEKEHPHDLRVVLRPVPVPTSVVASLDKSEISAQAAIAAGNQGRFWAVRDLLHAQYTTWTSLSVDGFKQWIIAQAPGLDLDEARFAKDLTSEDTVKRSQAMYAAATNLGVAGLPTVFVNGNLQPRAALSYDGLDSTIGLLALAPREYKSCPPFSIDPSKQYSATLHTEKGDIVIKLYAGQAPLAVNSFVFLARQGWYNGVTFHRVISGYVAQAGDPSGTGRGGPGYYFKNEVTTGLKFDKPGVVGMANSGPDTNGSQFFITYAPEPKLDGSYTIFGQVIEGMDVVESLTPRDPQLASGLPPGDKILSITIQEQ